jgi:hypothetical protein
VQGRGGGGGGMGGGGAKPKKKPPDLPFGMYYKNPIREWCTPKGNPGARGGGGGGWAAGGQKQKKYLRICHVACST